MIRGAHVWVSFVLFLFGESLGFIFDAVGWNSDFAMPFSFTFGAVFGSVFVTWLIERRYAS